MATPGLGFKGGILGFGVETTFGDKVTPTKFIEINSDGLTVEEERLHSEAIPQIYQDEAENTQGAISASGEVEFEMRYEGMELLLKNAMGSGVTAEVASFTVEAGVNDKIDFNIGAAQIQATVAAGSYKMGLTQITAGSLCKAIFDAIVAAEPTGTYTVIFDPATKKITIAETGGVVTTLQLLWKSGKAAADVLTVVADNKYFDFDIGAGELIATLTPATYLIGATQADAGSFCKALYDAIVAAEAVGVYTVSYSSTTHKFTITRSAGTFNILWKTGTHGSAGTDTHVGTLIGYTDTDDDTGALTYAGDTAITITATNVAALLGYAVTADDTGAQTYTADNAVVTVYNQTFTLTDDLPIGLTFEVDRDISAFTIEGGKINTLAMAVEMGGFLKATIGIAGEDMTAAAPTSPTLPTSALINFTQGILTYGAGPTNVPSASFALNNNLKTDRRFIGSRLISEPQRSGKIEVTGTFPVEFKTLAEYDDFRAATSRALTLIFTGGLIKTGHNYTLTVTFPVIKLTAGVPKIGDAGIISLELPFKAYATSGSAREFNIVLKNTLASI